MHTQPGVRPRKGSILMEENNTLIPENCTHDCSTCGAACAPADGEKKEPYGMFEKMDVLAQGLLEDDLQEMLAKLTEEFSAAE